MSKKNVLEQFVDRFKNCDEHGGNVRYNLNHFKEWGYTKEFFNEVIDFIKNGADEISVYFDDKIVEYEFQIINGKVIEMQWNTDADLD